MKKILSFIIVCNLLFSVCAMERQPNSNQVSHFEQLPVELKGYISILVARHEMNINQLIKNILKLRFINKEWSELIYDKFVWKRIFINFFTYIEVNNLGLDEQIAQSQSLIRIKPVNLITSALKDIVNEVVINRAVVNAIEQNNRVDALSLIKSMEEIKLKTLWANSVLFKAAKKNYFEIVERLAQLGIDINFRQNRPKKWSCGVEIRTILTIACNSGFIELVQKLIELGVDVQDEYGATALLIAIEHLKDHLYSKVPYKEIVELLIKAGANLNLVGLESPLVTFLIEKFPEIIEMLLDRGVDVNSVRGQFGNTALILASMFGERALVNKLIERGADLNLQTDSGETALSLAVCYGHYGIIDQLVKSSANLNTQNNRGETPLINFARGSGRPQVLNCLIDLNADIYVEDNEGNTAIDIAYNCNNNAILKKLLEVDVEKSGIIQDTDLEKLPTQLKHAIVKLIIQNQQNIISLINEILKIRLINKEWNRLISTKFFWQIIFVNFFTNLFISSDDSFDKQIEMSKEFISKLSAKLEAKIGHGTANIKIYKKILIPILQSILEEIKFFKTIAKKIASKEEESAYKLLSSWGYPVVKALKLKYIWGSTILISAIIREYNYIFNKLIQYKVDVNAKNISIGENPIQVAVRLNNYHAIEKLMESETCDLSICDKNGRTLLMNVIIKERSDWLYYITKCNSYINAQDKDGNTALIFAVLSGLRDQHALYYYPEEVVKMLIRKGADLNIKNNKGETALKLAGNNKKIVEMLLAAGAKA